MHGRDGVRRFAEQFLGAFREMRFVTRKVFPTGERAAARYFVLEVVLPDGRAAQVEGVDTLAVDERMLIKEVWSYYDPASLAAPAT